MQDHEHLSIRRTAPIWLTADTVNTVEAAKHTAPANLGLNIFIFFILDEFTTSQTSKGVHHKAGRFLRIFTH